METVLAWVNKVRADHGCEPIDALPKGSRIGARACPLAKGLQDCGTDVAVGASHVYIDAERIPLPEGIYQFRCDFDASRIPELIA